MFVLKNIFFPYYFFAYIRVYIHAPQKNGAKIQLFFHIRKFFLTITGKYYKSATFT